jgi:hypothetical protein
MPTNRTIVNTITAQQDANFKTVNNLLSLQDNHVEEFFQYHGEAFLTTLEKLMEDVTERVVSQMLSKLSFTTDGSKIKVNPDALREYERITQENIDLDIKNILSAALNQEVVNQRKLAKQQYLESQGFGNPMGSQGVQQAQGGYGQAQQMYGQGYNAVQNGSGYPVPPSGTDGYGRPYWIDPANGQMSYEPPTGGLHLAEKAQKIAAWGKWLM